MPNPTPSEGRREGRKLKDEALSLHERYSKRFVLTGRRLMLRLLMHEAASLTVDAVRARLPLPTGIDPKTYAAIPAGLAALKLIESTGFMESTRPEAHCRPVRIWRLKDRSAAELWLRNNPLPEDQRPPHDGPQLLLEI